MYSQKVSRTAIPVLAAVVSLVAAPSAMAQRGSTAIPENTVVRARLDETVSSRNARIGDRITATITTADRSGFPEGTRFEGTVTDAQRSSNEKPGVIGVDFRTAILPDGQRVTVDGSLTGLTEEDVRRGSDGRLMSRKRGSDSKMDLKWIGYGAAGGAVLGEVLGGGLLRGALLGGLGGAVYSYLNRDKDRGDFRDVSLEKGTEFGIRMDRRVAFNDQGNFRYSYRPTDFDEDRYYSDRTYRQRVLGDRQETRYGDVSVRMNGRNVNFTTARPMHINNVLYVPLADVARASNMRFNHRLGEDNFMLMTSRGPVRGTAGEGRISTRGGEEVTLTDTPISINGEIYVPTEFLTRFSDMRVNWDRSTMQLDLDGYEGQPTNRPRFDRQRIERQER